MFFFLFILSVLRLDDKLRFPVLQWANYPRFINSFLLVDRRSARVTADEGHSFHGTHFRGHDGLQLVQCLKES